MATTDFSKQRLVDIDKAKGFAIFLVVLGHIVSGKGSPPAGNAWYDILQVGIYTFHMPFFMYLSGLVFAYTYPDIDKIADYFTYILKKIKRLSIGYILFGILIYLGKISLSKAMHVDHIPNDYYSEIYNLLVIPEQSAGGSLWFVYVLMEMYIVFPLLMMLRVRAFILLIIGVCFYFLAMPHIFLLDRFVQYFLFFAIGVFVIRHYDSYLKFIDQYFLALFVLFILSFLVMPYVSYSMSKLIIGVSSLPALHGLMRNGMFSAISVWRVFGKYTYSIYLMNTIIIGIVKGVILLFTPWDGMRFLIIAPTLLFSAIYIPIFIKKYVFVKFPILDRATT